MAGKVIAETGRIGGWLRPVSAADHGELSEAEMRLQDGQRPGLLDIVEIRFKEARPDECQVENHLIDTACSWKRVGRFPPGRVSELLDSPEVLWHNEAETKVGTFDRISRGIAKNIGSSLYLIQPDGLRVAVYPGYQGKPNRVRTVFVHRGIAYNLAVTDPAVKAKYQSQVGVHHIKSATAICVSLGAVNERDDYRYKLVAAFVPAE